VGSQDAFLQEETEPGRHPFAGRSPKPQDLQRIPFTTKDDLRQNFPKGLLAVDMREVVRIHSSSGTTGIPTVIYVTRDDIDSWTDLLARSIAGTGATADDVFQNMMTYGLFTGGLGLHYGAERVGMTVIPIGGGNTKRQIQTMKDFQTTVVHITPSYCCIHPAGRTESFARTWPCEPSSGPSRTPRIRGANCRSCSRSTHTTPTV
jgi:phenylacetate-CoA ligase